MTDSAGQTYRKFCTSRGVFFVPWRSDCVAAFLADECIEPTDLRRLSTLERRKLCREFFLFACSECVANHGRDCASARRLAAFAKGLQNLVAGAPQPLEAV